MLRTVTDAILEEQRKSEERSVNGQPEELREVGR
jgi:hypothetical protein